MNNLYVQNDSPDAYTDTSSEEGYLEYIRRTIEKFKLDNYKIKCIWVSPSFMYRLCKEAEDQLKYEVSMEEKEAGVFLATIFGVDIQVQTFSESVVVEIDVNGEVDESLHRYID